MADLIWHSGETGGNAPAQKKRICLVFRSVQKGGKSIEGLFYSFPDEISHSFVLSRWKMVAANSFIKNIRSLRRQSADVFHITGDVYFLALFIRRKPVILTIHDIGRFKELSGWKKVLYKYWWIQWPTLAAKHIVTVSDYTRQDLIHLFPKLKHKISVIPNGIPSAYRHTERPFNADHPRILQVGTGQNKNLDTVIRALQGKSCTLVIIGPLTLRQQALLREENIRFEAYTHLTPAELLEQYMQSDIVMFVSTHEGFGLPVIEAQAIGRAVITSRCTAIPEIAGEGACYVDDPLDIRSVAKAIDKVCKDDNYRHELIRTGLQWSVQFTREKMIKRYFNLYEKMCTE